MYMFESFSEDLIPRVVPQPTVLPAQVLFSYTGLKHK